MAIIHDERESMKHNHVGIDVSAKTFTTIIDHDGERSEAFDLPNDAKGFKELVTDTPITCRVRSKGFVEGYQRSTPCGTSRRRQ